VFIKTVRKHRLKTKQQKHEKQRTDMNRKITLIAGTLLIAGIIPTYAATRAKTKSTDSKAASKPAAKTTGRAAILEPTLAPATIGLHADVHAPPTGRHRQPGHQRHDNRDAKNVL
jgi:hypothetical protein